jgi:hypothetical protein
MGESAGGHEGVSAAGQLTFLRGFEVGLGAAAGVDQVLLGRTPVFAADWSSIVL